MGKIKNFINDSKKVVLGFTAATVVLVGGGIAYAQITGESDVVDETTTIEETTSEMVEETTVIEEETTTTVEAESETVTQPVTTVQNTNNTETSFPHETRIIGTIQSGDETAIVYETIPETIPETKSPIQDIPPQ